MYISIVENKNRTLVYDVTDRTVYWCENKDWDKKARKRK